VGIRLTEVRQNRGVQIIRNERTGDSTVNLTIRTATLDDLAALDAHPPLPGVVCNHANGITSDGSTFLVGAREEQLVAHASVRWTGFRMKPFAEAFPTAVVISGLGVWPDSMRKQGIGTATVAELERLTRERNIDVIGLGVYSDNAPAQAFYQRLGYKDWGQGFVLDENTEQHPDGLTIMTKRL
jgi:GNAT superfamily N-acetyltransferase